MQSHSLPVLSLKSPYVVKRLICPVGATNLRGLGQQLRLLGRATDATVRCAEVRKSEFEVSASLSASLVALHFFRFYYVSLFSFALVFRPSNRLFFFIPLFGFAVVNRGIPERQQRHRGNFEHWGLPLSLCFPPLKLYLC